MPLHTQVEARRIGQREGFDQAIGSPGLHPQARRQRAHRLAVQRIHLKPGLVDDAREHAAGFDINRMRSGVLHGSRFVLGRTVVLVGAGFYVAG